MKSNKHQSDGFTLIELMIVIAIVAILVSLAVPAYQDFTIRAKVAECIAATAPPKIKITEYYQTMKNWPVNANQAGIDVSLTDTSDMCRMFFYNPGLGDYAILVNSNTIGVAATTRILPVMSPTESTGNINWVCTRGTTNADGMKYLPSSCRGDNIY